MRSRPASTTRTCTFTVSPGRNSGRSSRRRGFSTRSILFMANTSQDGFLMIAPTLPSPGDRHSRPQEVRAVPSRLVPGPFPTPPLDRRVVAGEQDLRDRHAPELDRKSTRLNSSHMSISYAVFCLKKKKKPHIPYTVKNKNTHQKK